MPSPPSGGLSRRAFLSTVVGGGAVAAGSSTATAQVTNNSSTDKNTSTANESVASTNGTGSGGNATGGNQTGDASASGAASGGTETVKVGPGGNFVFAPGTEKPLYITPGTKVKFVWESDNHNIVVGSQPDGANWKGTPGSTTYNTGYSYTHTFKTNGEYHYWCQPHKSLGMVADIVVNSSGQAPGGGSGGESEQNPEEMGVPFQAHFVGIATILMMVVSLIYTFFTVKYGESPHAKGGNN